MDLAQSLLGVVLSIVVYVCKRMAVKTFVRQLLTLNHYATRRKINAFLYINYDNVGDVCTHLSKMRQ